MKLKLKKGDRIIEVEFEKFSDVLTEDETLTEYPFIKFMKNGVIKYLKTIEEVLEPIAEGIHLIDLDTCYFFLLFNCCG